MSGFSVRTHYSRLRRAVFCLVQLLAFAGAGAVMAQETADLSPEEVQRLGERMYREGLLPSGEPMQAYVSGDVPVEGTAFTCVSCHLRSGLGSIEGGVVTTPTNGRILYQPRERYIPGAAFVPLIHNYAKLLPPRPAYTDASLEELLVDGVDPSGRSVVSVMPVYELAGRDLDIMIAYLKTLSAEFPPGATPQHLSFATVIVEGADPVAVESMVLPLQFSVDRKNSLAVASRANSRVARMGYNMLGDLGMLTFSLDRWILTGAPDTWRAQLDEYYQAKPVFALLGGISESTWEPVHRWCEDNQIPDLFPVVDYPVLSETDWYTLYFSRGVRQEGEAAARYLHGMVELFAGRPVVQVVRDSRRGRELAAGFNAIWAETKHEPALELLLAPGEELGAERLQQLVVREKPAVLLIWDDAKALDALEGLAGQAERPGMVLASGTYLDAGLWTVPESLRDLLYFTYPYRLPQDDARFDVNVRKVLAGKSMADYDDRILRQSYITQEVLGKALMDMRGEYFRDFLLDSIGMMMDQYPPLYERVSFGPGQRYASKGCYIVQLGKGDAPQLERRSEWVSH